MNLKLTDRLGDVGLLRVGELKIEGTGNWVVRGSRRREGENFLTPLDEAAGNNKGSEIACFLGVQSKSRSFLAAAPWE